MGATKGENCSDVVERFRFEKFAEEKQRCGELTFRFRICCPEAITDLDSEHSAG